MASALLNSLAAALPRLAPENATEEARLAGQLRLLAALIKALDRRSLGIAGRGDLVGILIRGGLPFGIRAAFRHLSGGFAVSAGEPRLWTGRGGILHISKLCTGLE